MDILSGTPESAIPAAGGWGARAGGGASEDFSNQSES